MKRILLLFLLLCIGCQDPVTEKVEDTVPIIDESKYAAAKQSTASLISSAEMKYLNEALNGNEKDCYSFNELDITAGIESGKVCYENNEYVAHDVYVYNYVCFGTINQINCEEVK